MMQVPCLIQVLTIHLQRETTIAYMGGAMSYILPREMLVVLKHCSSGVTNIPSRIALFFIENKAYYTACDQKL